MLNGLDLFAGIGGISLALQPWVQTVCYVEREPYAVGVLRSRIQSGDLEDAPIWDDVTTFDGEPWRGCVDIITAGFPCQDISAAGKGAGLEGERSGLFFEVVRLAEEIQPTFIFLENVPAIRTRGLDRVGKELADLGYDCRWGVVSAAEVGAPHLRKRWWLLARRITEDQGDASRSNADGIRPYRQETHQDGQGGSIQPGNEQECELGSVCRVMAHPIKRSGETGTDQCRRKTGANTDRCGEGAVVADTNPKGLQGDRHSGLQEEHSIIGGSSNVAYATQQSSDGSNDYRKGRPKQISELGNSVEETRSIGGGWSFEPHVGRVAHGVPHRVDRLKGLGNSVVPQTAREAFTRLMGI